MDTQNRWYIVKLCSTLAALWRICLLAVRCGIEETLYGACEPQHRADFEPSARQCVGWSDRNLYAAPLGPFAAGPGTPPRSRPAMVETPGGQPTSRSTFYGRTGLRTGLILPTAAGSLLVDACAGFVQDVGHDF
jgi:hypothetical protein